MTLVITNPAIEVICKENFYCYNYNFFSKTIKKHFPSLLPILFKQKIVFEKGQKIEIGQNYLDKNSYYFGFWEFKGDNIEKYFLIDKKDIRKEKLKQITSYK